MGYLLLTGLTLDVQTKLHAIASLLFFVGEHQEGNPCGSLWCLLSNFEVNRHELLLTHDSFFLVWFGLTSHDVVDQVGIEPTQHLPLVR